MNAAIQTRRADSTLREELQRLDDVQRRLTFPPFAGSPRLEAYDHWVAKCDEIDSTHGVQEWQKTAESAWYMVDQIAEAIADADPVTVEDAALKLRVLLSQHAGSNVIEPAAPFHRFAEDLARMADLERRAA